MSDQTHWPSIRQHIHTCMLCHRRAYFSRAKKLQAHIKQGKSIAQALLRLQSDIGKSQQARLHRQHNVPTIAYPEALPISQKRDDIKAAIAAHQVVIVAGETGSGKTTQLPKICLELGRGIDGMIGHTQPRRIAARSVATRIAEELNSPLGNDVGYKIRFADHTADHTYIKLMTDGILLAEIKHDALLWHYDTIIIDEAHERSLNIDFLLGYLKNILPKRPDLKIIITSATINTQRFSDFFHAAPIIEVSGRNYPVDIVYRPLQSEAEDNAESNDLTLQQGIIAAVDEAASLDALGDILVFLPGEREIRDIAHALHQHEFKNTEILPLFSRLSPAEQDKIFKGHQGRRIVLATNVAETSLTVPGIRFVIDTGLARISRYSSKNKIQQLPIEPISQAAANQRAGRCGRVAAGVCFRLYSEEHFHNRPEHTDPEIRRTNLAHVILHMIHLGLGHIQSFDFMDPPDKHSISDGYQLLEELQSIDKAGKLSEAGKQMIHLPVDPRLARMLVQAQQEGSLHEVLIIVAGLSVQDPKIRPHDSPQKADEKHSIFTDKTSDFLSWFMLWNWYHEQSRHLSKSRLRKICEQHFVSYLRMREWHDLHSQLLGLVHELNMQPNQQAAEPDAIHRALLSGLLSHIAMRHDEKGFLGARQLKINVFPGSPLSKKPPRWLMAASLVETSRLFARTIAPIDPAWLEGLATHLIQRTYSEPFWSKKRAQVCAYESLSLYGLPIIARRVCHFGPIDAVVSRQLFIRHALVMDEFHSFGRFFKHNQQLIQEIEHLEAKMRRRDMLGDEQARFDWFDAMIPEGIFSGKLFEQWRKKAEKNNPHILFLSKDVLLQNADELKNVDAYALPDQLEHHGLSLRLSYHFDPTHHADGICLHVPIAALGQVDAQRCEWLVPGLLEEKIVALIKSLPKLLRKHFVPAPQYAKACAEAMPFGQGSLLLALARQLKRITGVHIHTSDWNIANLPHHLHMSFMVVDDKGTSLATGNDLASLQAQFTHHARNDIQSSQTNPFADQQHITRWDFGDLPAAIHQQQQSLNLQLFPALVDHQTHVSIQIFESRAAAREHMMLGLRRLVMLSLHQQAELLRKNMPQQKDLVLYSSALGNPDDLKNDIIDQAFDRVFMRKFEQNNPFPSHADQFQALLDSGRAEVVSVGNQLAESALASLQAYARLQHDLQHVKAAALGPVVSDIRSQMSHLMGDRFVANVPSQWLPHLPRFIQAASIRFNKAGPQLKQDQQCQLRVNQFWQAYAREVEQRQAHQQSIQPLLEFRWLLEELRVSLFAQSLKTSTPVSVKRLEKMWESLTR